MNSIALSPAIIRSESQLANIIKRLRKIQGLSQVQLAKKAGVTQATISRVEQGEKSMAVGTLFLVFAALSVDFQVINRAKSSRVNTIEGLV